MVIDPRAGYSNAQGRREWALLCAVPRVNNHVDMDPEDCIPVYLPFLAPNPLMFGY